MHAARHKKSANAKTIREARNLLIYDFYQDAADSIVRFKKGMRILHMHKTLSPKDASSTPLCTDKAIETEVALTYDGQETQACP